MHSYAAFRLACRLLHSALMVIFLQLRKHHLPQREDQAASSQLIDKPAALPIAGDSRQLTSIQLGVMLLGRKGKATWLLRAVILKWQAVIMR